jgi:hypothetical protein
MSERKHHIVEEMTVGQTFSVPIAHACDQPEQTETDTQRWARICREDWTGAPWDPKLEQIIADGPDAQT